MLSLKNLAIITAYENSYKVTIEGLLLNGKNKILKPTCMNGYYEFSVHTKHKVTKIKVHRLQAYQKFGDKIFEQGIEVRHLNGKKLDNSWDNIAIGTHSDNMLDRPIQQRLSIAKNASVFATLKNRRFTDNEVQNILSDHVNGSTYNMLCEKYNTSKSTLGYLFNKALYTKNVQKPKKILNNKTNADIT